MAEYGDAKMTDEPRRGPGINVLSSDSIQPKRVNDVELSPLARRFTELREDLDRVERAFANLSSRLEPVMRPEYPEGEKSGDAEDRREQSILGEELEAVTTRLRTLHSRILTVGERIEL